MPSPGTTSDPTPWRSRGYLPHFEREGIVQSITFRLADALPRSILDRWEEELRLLELTDQKAKRQQRIAEYLDRGMGACHLQDPTIAELVEDALLHFDDVRYRLLAWCVMPNHVHSLIETRDAFDLAGILHTWKSFTAKKANEILGREGRFWQREYHDRAIRDWQHFLYALSYIEKNPLKARLVQRPEAWRWSSAWAGRSRPPIDG